MSFKNAKVVLLPTNQKAENGLILDTIASKLKIATRSNLGNKIFNTEHTSYMFQFQHLYFTIDKRPDIGDWYLVTIYNVENKPSTVLEQVKSINDGWINNEQIDTTRHINNCHKVVATTDLEIAIKKDEYNIGELSRKIMIPTETTILPQPSKLFIQKYLDMYNKKTAIESCMIEYEQPFPGNPSIFDKLKINSNNEITIKRIKDSWNREEVIDLFSKYQYDYAQWVLKMEYDLENKPTPVEWIKQNL